MSWTVTRPMAAGIAVFSVGIIAFVDWWAGVRFGLSIFYAVPVLFATWQTDRHIGLVVAVLAAAAWLLAQWFAADTVVDWTAQAWASAIRLGFFVLLVYYQSFLDKEKEHSRTDVLTELLNRRGFMERLGVELERARRRGRPVTLAYLDCDNFKEVNDRGGHRLGNAVLARAGQVLRTRLRQVDVAGRLGGDEFSVIMPETEREEAHVTLLRLRADLEDATREAGWSVTFSIGAITFDTVPESPVTALHKADALMYEVKRSGRNNLRLETEV